MAAHVLAMVVDMHLPASASLKDKRSVVRSIADGAHTRFAVAVAETGHLDLRQRSELTFCAVSVSATHACEVMDRTERFVWSFPQVEVLAMDRHWLEIDR